MKIFWLRTQDTPWGDYGEILFNGMSSRLPRIDGQLQLERTGPYLPPITFPRRGEVIITEALRHQIESGVGGALAVRAVIKARIVAVDWEHWPRDRLPDDLPPSREPEDLILQHPHDPVLSAAMGALWELDPSTVGEGEYKKVGRKPAVFHVTASVPASCPPLFRVTGVPVVLVREDTAELLRDLVGEQLRLDPVEVEIRDV